MQMNQNKNEHKKKKGIIKKKKKNNFLEIIFRMISDK